LNGSFKRGGIFIVMAGLAANFWQAA